MTYTPPLPTLREHEGHSAFATSLAILVLRLVLGWIFVYHGSQKLFGAFGGHGMEGFIKFITSLDLPLLPGIVWAYMAACGEFFGGLFVLLGLLTRLATVPIIVTMIVAITVLGKNGFSGYQDPIKGLQPGYEYNVALIAMSVALMLTGGGLVSLDALFFRRGFWARGPQPLSEPGKRSL